MNHKKKDKILFKLRLTFPWVELATFTFFPSIIYISFERMLATGDRTYLYTILFSAIFLTFFLFLANYSRKLLIIKTDNLLVKSWLTRRTKQYKKSEIIGFDLKETYDRTGIIKYVRIRPINGKPIAFIKDNYSNYEKLPSNLKRVGIQYLGTTEIQSKSKNVIGLITKIAFAVMIALFLLLQVVKSIY
jgi:hypothetical protein